MGQFISEWVTAAALVVAASAVHAQSIDPRQPEPVVDAVPGAPPPPAGMTGGVPAPYARDEAVIVGNGRPPIARPPGAARRGYEPYDNALPPVEVVRIIRSTGYEPLGPAVRRQWVYTISVITPEGDDGRVVLDARTGRIMRFVPADVSDEEVITSYGPPGVPPPSPKANVQKANVRTLRPPLPVPHVANRAPPAGAGKAEPRTVGAAPPTTATQSATVQAKPEIKPSETKTPDVKPAEPKPGLQLQPTQEMPAMQGVD